MQRRALCTCFRDGSYNELLNVAELPALLDRRVRLCETFYTKMNMSEHKLHHLLPIPRVYRYPLRQPRRLPQLKARTQRYGKGFFPWAVRVFDCTGFGIRITKDGTQQSQLMLLYCWKQDRYTSRCLRTQVKSIEAVRNLVFLDSPPISTV